VGACSEAWFEPSAGNRESLEEWESSDGVLVGWSHLKFKIPFSMERKKK